MNMTEIYMAFCVFCTQALDMKPARVAEFVQDQWPIVEEAVMLGNVSPCGANAHDLTCAFVQRQLFPL